MTSASTPTETLASAHVRDNQYVLAGHWTARFVHRLPPQVAEIPHVSNAQLALDANAITEMDTAGAVVLGRLIERLESDGGKVEFIGLRPEHQSLLELVRRRSFPAKPIGHVPSKSYIQIIGCEAIDQWLGFLSFLVFLGRLATCGWRAVLAPASLRWKAIAQTVQRAGYEALPITAVLGFLIGIVIAYQGGVQLRSYGANIFVVDLVGLTMLRELAPMIVAIIVAGRTGSAFTAQIGTMKVSEELDALRSIGIDPMELLVLPKVLGLMLVLPLLTLFGDLVGVWGGAVIAQVALDVNFHDFWDRFADAVPLSALVIGCAKAPLFAFVISMIGCYEGFQVRSGADSVGRQTTASVVQSIFMIIVLDGIVACVLSALGI